ncbi:MAG: 16S rRNA (guanine(966)-N(2))-methyltransferase RsmD [Thermodesulfobacteriota bacterium]|nr:16S rRNA (guanine(966)-N(2))-methyltransferase RsmD [Thermodesulfobacteriota bacterium]
MRIISGTNKGKKLSSIPGRDIRPTSDRAREAVFNILGQRTIGAQVLDLFAGTGALGLEALSRGAEEVCFIDVSQTACAVIKKNIELCRCHDRATLICQDLTRQVIPFNLDLEKKKFDLIFMDPPYGGHFLKAALTDPGLRQAMGEDTLIIAEHSVKEKGVESISGLDIMDQRKYSRSLITFFTRTQESVRNECIENGAYIHGKHT